MLAGPFRRRRLRLRTRAAALGVPDRGDGVDVRGDGVDVPTSVFWNDGGWSLADFEPIRTRRAGEGRSDVARRGAVRARPGAVRWMSRTPSTSWWREVRLKAFEGGWEILATPKMPRGLAGRSTAPGRARRCSPRPCTPIDATAALDVIWMPGGLRRLAAWSKPLSGSGRSDCLPRLRIEDELPQLRFGVG